ncbi:hypothetical protein C8J57DRAFT_1298033 [Mycena rebaudengoi]|nr:hypothetical protein C8J57DRAFT_1298033 [Mycena rebaudengoi]
MGFCYNDECLNSADQRCSNCKLVTYCSTACQKKGCNVRFARDYPANDTCPDCGYTACESCVCHNSRGSCYCQNSNFGRRYCIMAPRHYHLSSRNGRAYAGDRHPDYRGNLVVDGPEQDTMFEKRARECGNCGESHICMTKEGIQREKEVYLRRW